MNRNVIAKSTALNWFTNSRKPTCFRCARVGPCTIGPGVSATHPSRPLAWTPMAKVTTMNTPAAAPRSRSRPTSGSRKLPARRRFHAISTCGNRRRA